MRFSRGMGAVSPSKMPGQKTVVRKDNPNDVALYAAGGTLGRRARLAQTLKGMRK